MVPTVEEISRQLNIPPDVYDQLLQDVLAGNPQSEDTLEQELIRAMKAYSRFSSLLD